MTGFGSASSDGGDWALRVEVRSVNHRHLLVKARLPLDFAFLEGELERVVRKKLERGAVTVHLHATRLAPAAPAALDAELVRRYKTELDRIAAASGLEGVQRLEVLLGLPGVVRVVPAEDDAGPESERALALVARALDRLIEMRGTEGASLAEHLRHEAEEIAALVARVRARMPEVTRGHQESLKKRVDDLLDRRQLVSEADLAREIALLADRLDVSEELARLESHLGQVEGLLAKAGIVGRKLDFLVQELFREINTIGSKCNDAQVAHWVIDAKTHVERMREQVQNVE